MDSSVRRTGPGSVARNPRGMAAIVLLACVALAGCESRITASATANATTQYSHVYVTVEQVWLNTSATAGPDDAGWLKYTLPDPQTLDLVALTNGAVSALASSVPAPPATYNQLRLILSDTSATLTDSASTAGASFNNEVDYIDSAGTTQQSPLAVTNAAQGVGIPIVLKVPTASDAILGALAGASSTTTGTTGTTGTTTNTTGTTSGLYTGVSNTSTSTTQTSTLASSSSSSDTGTVTATALLVLNAARDVVPFTYSGVTSFVLNASLTGSDVTDAGTIRSQVNIGSIVVETNTNRAEIQVTAETPNADGTRNVPVLSAPVRSDGTFVLYPFPTDTDSPTAYDLVIHGPRVQTVIVKAVPVTKGSPTTATTVALSSITLVPVTPYTVNVDSANVVTPRGARVGFYQTISATGELPYLIEERPVDPVTGLFADDQMVSSASLLVGTYSSGTPALSTAVPVEGTGAYKVAASAPVYSDGVFGATVTAPATITTTAVTFAGPTIAVPSTATSGIVTASLTVATPGRYDKGVLVLSHDGAIVSVVALDSMLAQATGTVPLSGVPGGSGTASFDAGVYYAEAWVWNSGDAIGTFSRQASAVVIDLRAGSTASTALTIN